MQLVNETLNGRRPRRVPSRIVVVWAIILVALASAASGQTRSLELLQSGHFTTGFDGGGTPLLIPSIDPAGICYHAPSGHLFIADSEINEVAPAWDLIGANIFEVSLAGDTLVASYDLTALGNNEPTGITYNEFDGYFYVSNDDSRTVSRYSYDAVGGFSLEDVVSTTATAGATDPEGITADPGTGLLYVIDGVGGLLVVYSHDGSAFVLQAVLDLAALNDPANMPTDPEGIGFDSSTGTLYIVSDPDRTVYEFTTGGLYLARYSLNGLVPATVAPQGLGFGAPSPGNGGLAAQALYFSDGGVDNDANPDERDGAVYEAVLVEQGSTNQPPVLDPIGNQMVDEMQTLVFTATASDLDDPADNLTFSLGGVVPAGAVIDPITGAFAWTPTEAQGPGDYPIIVRVTDDGVPSLSDEEAVTVTVNEINQPPTLDPVGDHTVAGGSELAFVATATDPDLAPGLTADLIAYWPFDSDFLSGTGGHDGVPMNGAVITQAAGESVLGAGALSLDGVNDYVDFGEIPLIGDLTLAAWVRPENIAETSASGAVVFGDAANRDWVRLESDTFIAKFDNLSTRVTTEPDFVNSQWQHFAMVRSGSALTIYRNGQVVATGSHALAFYPEFLGLKSPNTNYYQGLMDDVAVWSRDLSSVEIAALYNDGDGRTVSDAATVPANALAFSLEGTVPAGAFINASSGGFTWTPSQAQTPGIYVFAVRVTDDGIPSYFDEETITVTVEDGGPIAPELQPIGDLTVDEGQVLGFVASLGGGVGGDLADGLLDYWNFDVDFSDATGARPGTGVGDAAITTTDVKLGAGALTLDGAGDYVDVGDVELAGDFAVSVWILPSSIQSGTAGGANGVLLGDAANADWFRLQLEAVTAKWNNVSVVGTTEPDFTNDEWQHVVLVRESGQVTVYRNAVPVTTFTHTAVFTPEHIGHKDPGGNFYQGVMDDLAIWGRAIASDDVAMLYNGGNGLPVLVVPDGSVTFTLVGDPPSGAGIDPVSGYFSWTPSEIQGPNQYSLTIRAANTAAPELFDEESFLVDVFEVNQAPQLAPIADQSVDEGIELSIMAQATDPDVPVNMLTYSLGGLEMAGLSIDSGSGMLSWIPSEEQGPGVYTLTIRVTDDGVPALSDEQSFTVTVAEVNTPPVLAAIGEQAVAVGSELAFTALADDPDRLPGVHGGLVSHWSFDADFASSTGFHDGVPMNGAAITSTPDEVALGGGALVLDGADDFLDFGDIPLGGEFTVAAWVRPSNIDSLVVSSAIVFGDAANADWIRLEAEGVRAKWGNVTTVMPSDPSFVNGAYQHFALTRSGTTVSVYRNGDLIASGVRAETFTPEYLGLKTPNANYYGGQLDDTAVWARALDATDLQLLYGGGTGVAIGDAGSVPANSLTFSLEGAVPTGATIDPVTGAFSWTPTVEQGPGVYEVTVRVTDDGAPTMFAEEVVPVTVTDGLTPICVIEPDSLAFGEVEVGQSLDGTFMVTNGGEGLLVGTVSEECDHFSVTDGAGEFSLAAGDTLWVVVSFAPTEVGDLDCVVELAGLCSDVVCQGTGVNTTDVPGSERFFALRQNQPNPFNPLTTVRFNLATAGSASLVVFDVQGRRIRTLVQGDLAAGAHSVRWNGLDDHGRRVTSGTYFAKLVAGPDARVIKMTLLK